MKLVLDRQRIVKLQLAFTHLMKEFDHDGNFHGACGVEGVVGTQEPLRLAVESAEGETKMGAAVLNKSLYVGRGFLINECGPERSAGGRRGTNAILCKCASPRQNQNQEQMEGSRKSNGTDYCPNPGGNTPARVEKARAELPRAFSTALRMGSYEVRTCAWPRRL